MKTLLTLATIVLISPSVFAAPERSEILEYAGNYSSAVTFSAIPGSAVGSFKTSKTKENGKLTLNSAINIGGGAPLALNHVLTIRGRKLMYLIGSQFLTAPGSGTVKVRNKVISYSGTANYGGSPASFTGTIRRTRNALQVVETTVLGQQSQVVTYSLKSKRRK